MYEGSSADPPQVRSNCESWPRSVDANTLRNLPLQVDPSSETHIPMSDEDSADNIDQLDLMDERAIDIDGAMLNLKSDKDIHSDSTWWVTRRKTIIFCAMSFVDVWTL